MFEPENDLERSLIRAVTDPAHRPDFLRKMFNEQTFVALEVEGPLPRPASDGRVKIPPGAKVTLRTVRAANGQEYVPFFTALSRARAKGNAESVFSHMTTSDLFKRQSGRQFVLNPGFEHAQTFSADDIKRMLMGRFDAPVAAAADNPSSVAPVPRPAIKQPEPEAPENKLLESKTPQSQPFEFKPPLPKPPVAAPQPQALQPPAPNPAVAPAPLAPQPRLSGPVFAADDEFVFKRTLEQALGPAKPVSESMPRPAFADIEAKRKPSPAVKIELPDVTAVPPAPKPVELKPAAPKPPATEKITAFKTAATEALATIRRFATKAPASSKPDGIGVASATPVAPTEPPTRKPIESEWADVERLAAPESAAAKPAEAKPATAKPAEVSPPRAAAIRAEIVSPSAPPKPVALTPSPPAPIKRAAVPPPPGSQIGRPDPYPIDVLMALTSAVQSVPAIEAAYLAQVQLQERAPYLLVALDASQSWKPLMQQLGPQLQKFLPAGRQVEMTPLAGGMFEDYFRNETQPFFKRR